MSTLIVTYAAEMLGCFTHNGDGELEQKAMIHVGQKVPTAIELAQLGQELSVRFRWGTQPQLTKPSPKALPAGSRPNPRSRGKGLRNNPKGKDRYNNPNDTSLNRKARILTYLETHPDSTKEQIMSGLDYDMSVKGRQRIGNTIKDLRVEGLITHKPLVKSPNIFAYSLVVQQ